MHRTRPSSIALACCLAALLPSAADAQQPPGRIEIVPLQTRSPANRDVLRGEPQAGREATVAGELRLPAGAPPGQRVPAVVLLHDSAGPGAALDAWAKELNAAGAAAFLLDSFTGRGIADTIADQSRLSGLAVMVDAYRALDWLAAHPRIRPDRIAVMGFSRGATAAVYSAMERFARLLGGPDRRFALHIGFYGPCYVAYEGDTRVGAPIRLFHGAEDDYVPAQPCRDYVARLREAGADATLTEYAGARHAFDNPLIPPLFALRSAQAWRNCRLREGPDGAILNAATGAVHAPASDPCVERGAHVGHSPEATAAARGAVRDLVAGILLR